MKFALRIKHATNPINIDLGAGEKLFVLGPNGAGKSSLMNEFSAVLPEKTKRILSHRQNWLSSGDLSITHKQNKDFQLNITHFDRTANARWRDDYSSQRPSVALFELLDSENARARAISAAASSGDMELVKKLAEVDSPIKIINDILKIAGVDVSISFTATSQSIATNSSGQSYSIAELSDGERATLLIAAEILMTPAGHMILVDEPERHLHRSIISPLLTELFSKRSDCAFVVSTHEPMLPVDNKDAKVLLVRSCTYKNGKPESWDADLLNPGDRVAETVRQDILGNRRSILFVEGGADSLDTLLYNIVFPRVSMVPKNSCKDVEHATSGVRGSEDLHWVRAYGIVDNDRRTPSDIENLISKYVYPLSVYSVESIYYHPEIQKMVAYAQAQLQEFDPVKALAEAKAEVIKAVGAHLEPLCARVAEKAVNEKIIFSTISWKDILVRSPINVTVDAKAILEAEIIALKKLIDRQNDVEIICKYPVRETPALARIACKLGFQNREKYEGAVRKLLAKDPAARELVLAFFGDLKDHIDKNL